MDWLKIKCEVFLFVINNSRRAWYSLLLALFLPTMSFALSTILLQTVHVTGAFEALVITAAHGFQKVLVALYFLTQVLFLNAAQRQFTKARQQLWA